MSHQVITRDLQTWHILSDHSDIVVCGAFNVFSNASYKRKEPFSPKSHGEALCPRCAGNVDVLVNAGNIRASLDVHEEIRQNRARELEDLQSESP